MRHLEAFILKRKKSYSLHIYLTEFHVFKGSVYLKKKLVLSEIPLNSLVLAELFLFIVIGRKLNLKKVALWSIEITSICYVLLYLWSFWGAPPLIQEL